MSGFALTPGTYTYYVTYDAEDNEVNKINIKSDDRIYKEPEEVSIQADYYGTGKLTIVDIQLVKTTAVYRMLLTIFLPEWNRCGCTDTAMPIRCFIVTRFC